MEANKNKSIHIWFASSLSNLFRRIKLWIIGEHKKILIFSADILYDFKDANSSGLWRHSSRKSKKIRHSTLILTFPNSISDKINSKISPINLEEQN